jgi:hypothetical protein
MILIVAVLSVRAYTQTNAPVHMQVCSVAQSDNSQKYVYRVLQSDSRQATDVTIGVSTRDGSNKLKVPPKGFDPFSHIEDQEKVLRVVTGYPQGWDPFPLLEEGSDGSTMGLQWRWAVSEQAPPPANLKFSVLVATADKSYANNEWGINFSDETSAVGVLEAIPQSTPSINVSLSPTSLVTSHSMAQITAVITVTDQVDDSPTITLQSITASDETDDSKDISAVLSQDTRSFSVMAETSGASPRVYTVTYSATNYCGNTSTAKATITVQPPSQP